MVVAKTRGIVRPLFDHQIVQLILYSVEIHDNVKEKAAKLVKYVSNSYDLVIPLIKLSAFRSLCVGLSAFKSFESILSTAYHYTGPSFNFDLARDIIITLENIVNVGELEMNSAGGFNYTNFVDLDSVDKLNSFLKTISENKSSLDAWRSHYQNEEKTEDKLKTVLIKLKNRFEKSSAREAKQIVAISNEMRLLSSLSTQLFQTKKNSPPSTKIQLFR